MKQVIADVLSTAKIGRERVPQVTKESRLVTIRGCGPASGCAAA